MNSHELHTLTWIFINLQEKKLIDLIDLIYFKLISINFEFLINLKRRRHGMQDNRKRCGTSCVDPVPVTVLVRYLYLSPACTGIVRYRYVPTGTGTGRFLYSQTVRVSTGILNLKFELENLNLRLWSWLRYFLSKKFQKFHVVTIIVLYVIYNNIFIYVPTELSLQLAHGHDVCAVLRAQPFVGIVGGGSWRWGRGVEENVATVRCWLRRLSNPTHVSARKNNTRNK
jgi:hypothetical protein